MIQFLNQPWGPYYTVGESLLMLSTGVGMLAMFVIVLVQHA